MRRRSTNWGDDDSEIKPRPKRNRQRTQRKRKHKDDSGGNSTVDRRGRGKKLEPTVDDWYDGSTDIDDLDMDDLDLDDLTSDPLSDDDEEIEEYNWDDD